jgi:hypothetical protein
MERVFKASLTVFMSAVLAACAAGGLLSSPTVGSRPPTPASTPSPVPSASLTHGTGAFPATIMNMPVMTVAAAQAAVALGALDGRFAAVGGYWMQYALPCPFPVHAAVIEGYCSGGKFSDNEEDVLNPGGGIGGGSAPVSVPETMNGDRLWSAASEGPARVVLIVHAGDSRAWQCLPDQQAECLRHMAIDAVAWVNGTSLPIATASVQYDATPGMTLAQIATVATGPGEQLVTAYALPATHLNELDPRLLGEGSGVVWYVRVAQPVLSGDATAAGTVQLISDADGSVIDELPLKVAANYSPARLVLDSKYSGTGYPRFTVTQDTVLADDHLDLGTTPIAIQPGEYTLHAFMADANGTDMSGPGCDQAIAISAGANVAYTASFRGSACSWGPGDSTF